jgi:Raf kinase inhibitor-like YbhB/YbcL family protein
MGARDSQYGQRVRLWSRRSRVLIAAFLAVGLFGSLAACSDGVKEPAADVPASISVSSPAFGEGSPVPTVYTCKGRDVSPPLRWSGVPAGTSALALVVDDPDAPNGTYVHWVVADIAAGSAGVAEGAVPDGGVEVANSSGRNGYRGPCPPSGTHHYRFTVYALRQPLQLGAGTGTQEALDAVAKAALAQGRLTGTFSK